MASEESNLESETKNKSFSLKFVKLLEPKHLLEELLLEVSKNKTVNLDFLNPTRKIVHNNNNKKLLSDQEKLLELGLNFAIIPRKFPSLEYIAAVEDLCMSLEEYGDDESVEKAQRIQSIMISHVKKGVGMKIKQILSSDEKKILKEIISDPNIIICPADKGRAIVIEDRETYLLKMRHSWTKVTTLLIIGKRKRFWINCTRK